MKTRILSVVVLGLFFLAGTAFSPSAEKVTPGPSERRRGPDCKDYPCPPGFRCVADWEGYYWHYYCAPKGNHHKE